ncbi:MAG: hypothetical protein OEZ02_14020, partial [Anaerolineae bacterium]|nr:hypothetical protein [Anaerolineae bacterium]
MSEDSASVVEIRLDAEGHRQALIVCPAAQAPAAGQYIQAHAPEDDEAVLAVSLFAGGLNHPGGRNMEGKVEWLSAPGIPASWQPGSRLRLRGPLGRGFEMPANTRKVALAALDTSAARLAPVVGQAVKDNIEVAIFSEAALMDLPSEVEVNALDELAQALNWPDRLLIDMRLDQL